MAHSGLQRDVLSLYRKCLRVSRTKGAARLHFEKYARIEFDKAMALDKKDFGAIEYLIRKGHRQIEMAILIIAYHESESPLAVAIRSRVEVFQPPATAQEEPIRRLQTRRDYSDSTLDVGERASVRARHNIQVLGWDTPGAELASKVTTEDTGSGYLLPNRTSRSGATLPPGFQDDSAIPSTDGAVSRRLNPSEKKSENEYSLRHVYWTADRLYSAPRSGPLQAASNRIPRRRRTEGSRKYDLRADPLSPVESQRRELSTRPRFKSNTFRKATSQVSPTQKDTGLGSPDFWEAVRDYSRQSKELVKSTPSVKSIVHSLLSETASRTPSQKKVLQRFTEGLELYLQAAKEHASKTAISSASLASSTSISAYTIQELKPYRSEFQSAGLAVTSAEQKGMAKLQTDLTPPPTPPKDNKYKPSRFSAMKKSTETRKPVQNAKLPSYASGSTGTTVLGWTPSHEKTYARPPALERRSSASTDHTIIGFTPPHEMYASPKRPAREAPASPRASTKKSLPWLRRPTASNEPSPTKKMSVTSVKPEQHRPSTPLLGWVPTFDTIEPIEPTQRKSEPAEKPLPGISEWPTEAKWKDLRYNTRHSTADKHMSKVVTEMATQTDPSIKIPTEKPKMIHLPSSYVNIGTQTVEFSHLMSRRDTMHDTQAREQSDIDRAPLSSIRSQTFPLKSNNSKGECMQPFVGPLPSAPIQRSTRQSKVMWKGVDHETQATIEPQDPDVFITAQKLPSFQYNAVTGIGPYQPPQQPKSPNRSMGDGKWVQNDRQSDEPALARSQFRSLATSRRHSPPPLCTQCAGPLDREPEIEQAPTPEPERPPPAHSCTARSSTQCQQCFPSRNSSTAISPLNAISPVEVRAPVEVQYFPSRRSTRPIIPTGPFDYPNDTTKPAEPELVIATPKSYRTPERKRTQSKAEASLLITPKSHHSPERTRAHSKAEMAIEEYTRQEPMADPMKRPSLPRRKLKPVKSDPPKHVHCYSTVLRPNALPQMSKVPLVDAVPLPAFASTASNDSCSLDTGQANDKQVFKGLHVATAAACDEDVDKWIEEITGSSARNFLSRLSAFDGLGVNTLADVARRAAKQRREKVNAWEAAREKRVAEQDQNLRCELEDYNEVEYMPGDQYVRLGSQPSSQRNFSDKDDGNGEYRAHDRGIKK